MAENLKDAHLHRDALKRIANVYLEIARGAPPFGPINEPEIFSTIEELDLLSIEVVEENEAVDLIWLRKFSKARGIYHFRKMRELCVV